MRSYGVEDPFPVAELTIELFHFKRAGRDLVKLLGVGAVITENLVCSGSPSAEVAERGNFEL